MDSGIAMAALLNVVDPAMTGIGGDGCLLYYSAREARVVGLVSTGRAPQDASIEAYRQRGLTEMPLYGPLSITVPGVLDGWCTALERYGTRTLAELLEPAIHYAETGFPVGRLLARQWASFGQKRLAEDPDALQAYLRADRQFPAAGELLMQPDLARTLRLIAAEGRDAVYDGTLTRVITESIRSKGGLLSAADLANYRSDWVEPLMSRFCGLDVAVLPPSHQGVALLEQLRLLEAVGVMQAGWNTSDALHLQIEVTRLALDDLGAHVSDPEFSDPVSSMLLSAEHIGARGVRIRPDRALDLTTRRNVGGSNTTCVVAIDAAGNALSLMNSLRDPFGSGVVAAQSGILLHNRGRDFSLDPRHVNHLEPRKRTMHTLCPVMVLERGIPRLVIGTVGGVQQTQGTQQVLVNHLMFGMDLQAALDSPRWAIAEDNKTVHFEPTVPSSLVRDMTARGHETVIGGPNFGRTQAVAVATGTGVRIGASDSRSDGAALGF